MNPTGTNQPTITSAIRIAIVGDFDASVAAHQAIAPSFALVTSQTGLVIDYCWVATDTIAGEPDLEGFNGVWCVPKTPYRSMDGALCAIRFARERGIPFLGTCGGFQHAIVEYARNVLGWADAEHAESAPDASRAVISPLTCALVETSESIDLVPCSAIQAVYGLANIVEGYRCRYGLAEDFREQLLSGPLRVAATDAAGDVRAIELTDHPFFIGTLFQPERAALRGEMPPLVAAFAIAASRGKQALAERLPVLPSAGLQRATVKCDSSRTHG